MPGKVRRFPAQHLGSALDREVEALRARWILRGLLHVGGLRGLQVDLDFNRQNILEAVGLDAIEVDDLSRVELTRRLRARLEAVEAKPVRRQGALFSNVAAIGEQLALSAVEQEILLFVVCLQTDDVLETVMDYLGALSSSTVLTALARILALSGDEVAMALRAEGILACAGLVRIDHDGNYPMKSKLDVLQGLPNLICCEHEQGERIFARYVHPAPPARLKADDFAHVQTDFMLLTCLLTGALRQRTVGVNVLLYGPPGTGKTELVRTVALSCQLALYEVSVEDQDGDALGGSQRASAYRLAQHLLRQRDDCIVLFDEVEDVFSILDFPFAVRYAETGRSSKGWMNQLLESNPVPALWLCNEISHIDPAFLRRFDFVLELGPPPREVRQRMLGHYLDGIAVGADWIARMADLERLTPAHMERAARVARLVGAGQVSANEARLDRVLGNSLQAMGLRVPTTVVPVEPIHYDLGLVNASVDLERLMAGLASSRQGRICLYGPPGTGKSGFAVYTARRLDKPLICKQASDLLGKYVGETETHIAAMFREAESSGGVLLVDEADSFLRDRQIAHHGWEVTQVNELLVQMEAFRGVLICATNLMDGLDPAVLRRFDLKIKLDFLRPEQAVRLFRQCLKEAGTLPADEAQLGPVERSLITLDNLTPGDFATVGRKVRLLNLMLTAETLLAALTEESRAKPGGCRQPIGFTS